MDKRYGVVIRRKSQRHNRNKPTTEYFKLVARILFLFGRGLFRLLGWFINLLVNASSSGGGSDARASSSSSLTLSSQGAELASLDGDEFTTESFSEPGQVLCSLRDDRVAERKRLTDAVVTKGGDSNGIARATGAVTNITFPEGKPTGNRDKWSEGEQKRITVSEHHAANKVNDLPGGYPSVGVANDQIVESARQGAREGRNLTTDPEVSGTGYELI